MVYLPESRQSENADVSETPASSANCSRLSCQSVVVFPFQAAIAASITVLLAICHLSPDYRDDPEASYAQPGIGQEIYCKEGAKYCHADAAGNSYRFADPSLAFQQAPPLVNHQQKGAGIGFI